MADFNITMKRGDTRSITITATLNGVEYPLADKTVWFTGKRKSTDADVDAVISKETGAGIAVMPAPNDHKAIVSIDSADTSGLSRETQLVCDVQVMDGANIYTIAEGKLTIQIDVKHGTA